MAALPHKAPGAEERNENPAEKQVIQSSGLNLIRAGMIGCDTSHCGVYTRMLNDEQAPEEISGVRVTAAYPSFSEDMEKSVGRVKDISRQLSENWGVKMTGSIEEMLEQVDVVLLTSVDGRRHLKELRPVAASGKPVYIDKPFAASLTDAREMVRVIREHDLPCFSCSPLRFDSRFVKFMSEEKARGRICGCDACGPAHRESTNPGFFWYGIHGVEILYTVMGPGCRSVRCISTDGSDLAAGTWDDGRIGTMRGIHSGHGQAGYGATVLCDKVHARLEAAGDFYRNTATAMVRFFRTRKPPVPIDETLEICAFIDAAWQSSKQNGEQIKLNLFNER